jgi:hypothetical protein
VHRPADTIKLAHIGTEHMEHMLKKRPRKSVQERSMRLVIHMLYSLSDQPKCELY